LTLECEKCFYIRKSECPEYPHRCALEEELEKGDPETKVWVRKNLADKIKMRERFRKYEVSERGA